MKIETVQIRIRELISLFVTQVKGATAQGDLFLNSLAEPFLIPLLREVYDLPNLRSLNHTERKNFPAIDLADDDARVAIQVTATSTSEKVKETLRLFREHSLYERYDRLIVYILSEKQTRYSGSRYDDIVEGYFAFDREQDIVDYRDVLSVVAGFEVDRAERVLDILETNFGSHSRPNFNNIPSASPMEGNEMVFLNLLEISFPDYLFMAEIVVDRQRVIKQSRGRTFPLNHDSSTVTFCGLHWNNKTCPLPLIG